MPKTVKNEIERKFLVFLGNVPNLEQHESYLIQQGYLKSADRLRRKLFQDGSCEYFLENKIGSGLVRPEGSEDITKAYFNQHWPETMGSRLEKRRYQIPLPKHTTGLKKSEAAVAELDFYLDANLSDLITVEVEFTSVESSERFIVPDWFGREVTGMSEYDNYTLATVGMPAVIHLETGLNRLVRQIKVRLEQESEPLVIAMAGGSASGKSSAAELLHKYFEEYSVLISLDDYYLGADKMEVSNWDDSRALNLDLCAQHLTMLKNGSSIRRPIYDFKQSKSIGTEEVNSKKIIIVEGIFALHEKFEELSDIKVFVDANVHTRLVRKLFRDIIRTSQTMTELASYYFKKAEPAHQNNIQSTISKADLIINNDYHAAEDQRLVDIESQLKFPVSQPNGVMSLTELDNINQVDYYCVPRGINDLRTTSLLRLRVETRGEGEDEEEKDSLFSITYKGMSRADSVVRNRAKIEVAELDELIQNHIFSSYQKVLTICKHRKVYQLDNVTIYKDYVTLNNGEKKCFLELVGEPNDIKEVAVKLGLYLTKAIKESYFELFTTNQN